MLAGLAYGLFAAIAWGVVDIAGALAVRQVGSLRVQVGTLVVGAASFVAFALLRPDLLGPDPLPGVILGFPLGAFAASVLCGQIIRGTSSAARRAWVLCEAGVSDKGIAVGRAI